MSTVTGYRHIDTHLARFFADRSGLAAVEKERFARLVEELSLSMASGHSCLVLENDDIELAAQCPIVTATSASPLVLFQNRLYFQRYYSYERNLAVKLNQLANISHTYPGLEQNLDLLFGKQEGEPDYQRGAARMALEKSLSLISGGPGTGKTTTVVKILALLHRFAGGDIRIGLAAPTGKAAMRLQESVSSALAASASPMLSEVGEVEAMTLHRLLGPIRNSVRFRHNSENPLPWDVLIIDEASMVDLALMSKVVAALKPSGRLILVGDKDQLASVESGAVLAECTAGLPGNTVQLQRSYRFDGAIRDLAAAINCGDAKRGWQLLKSAEDEQVSVYDGAVAPYIGKQYEDYLEVVDRYPGCSIGEIFDAFNRFQLLSATRHGAGGVVHINQAVEHHLQKNGWISPQRMEWYNGRPVMVTANDYSLGLLNGDIGICLEDKPGGTMRVWFERGDGTYQSFLPFRLPVHETVYAMTIHKSQGSEFDNVLVVLPDGESRILSRQLVYTAVTRAREQVQLAATFDVFNQAISYSYPRTSGLADMLMEESSL